eukprot:750989-Prymnesium_polylepis.2
MDFIVRVRAAQIQRDASRAAAVLRIRTVHTSELTPSSALMLRTICLCRATVMGAVPAPTHCSGERTKSYGGERCTQHKFE